MISPYFSRFFQSEWAQPPPGQLNNPIDLGRVLAICFVLTFFLLAAAVLFTATATDSMCWITWHDLNQQLSWSLGPLSKLSTVNLGHARGPSRSRRELGSAPTVHLHVSRNDWFMHVVF